MSQANKSEWWEGTAPLAETKHWMGGKRSIYYQCYPFELFQLDRRGKDFAFSSITTVAVLEYHPMLLKLATP
jgi:hypothetical protein